MPPLPLWTPSPDRIASANLTDFVGAAQPLTETPLHDYSALHAFSLECPDAFWSLVWDECGVVGSRGQTAFEPGGSMMQARFFPDARLNYAENVLANGPDDDTDALVFRGEAQVERRISWRDLRRQVACAQIAMRDAGVGEGDRVAAVLPNMPEAIIAMLAAASLGALWSSCSPDFGPEGILSRFAQIEPKLVIGCDEYVYNGKTIPLTEKMQTVAAALPNAPFVWTTAYAGSAPTQVLGTSWSDIVSAESAGPTFVRLPFDHPLFILFSSGTTGTPKCILHGAGRVLLQHLKEHRLHSDIKPDDRVFYFTTCGWMMWNWLATALASARTLLLYDGSPFAGSDTVILDYLEDERATFFGTSAKYIDACRKAGVAAANHDLSALCTVASTGSPLTDTGFAYVYDAIKADVHLASISGGTDIVSCFVLGVPTEPVYSGQIQAAGLGMSVEVWRPDGELAAPDEKGELVCTKPFPAMPIGFWNDADGERYRASYFSRFDNVWNHGDYAAQTAEGGFVIFGRSDATLNPGGVRIGTAEIYAQVERVEPVLESVAIGQKQDDDERIVLFVTLRDGIVLDDTLRDEIRKTIRQGATPRHMPAKIVQVSDIPRTKSGKIVEIAVRNVVHGEAIDNVEALANPAALDEFRDRPELA